MNKIVFSFLYIRGVAIYFYTEDNAE